MKRLSDENATANDYAEVFKTAGVELGEEEVKAMREQVKKIMADPERALSDMELDNVSGGAVKPLSQTERLALKRAAQTSNSQIVGAEAALAVMGIGCLMASKFVKKPETSSRLKYVGACSLTACGALFVGKEKGLSMGVFGTSSATGYAYIPD